ncbi:MAG: hypothetical protein WC428_02240 [Candidatus Paceibacterota bacterium]
MKIHTSITLPVVNIKLLIIEVDDNKVKNSFDNRFQLAVEFRGKRFFPKNKQKFLQFEDNNYLYTMLTNKLGTETYLNSELFFSLKLCDRLLEDVNTEAMHYISLYNQGTDLKKELKKTYKF